MGVQVALALCSRSPTGLAPKTFHRRRDRVHVGSYGPPLTLVPVHVG